ncbi:uncharacterized protein LOC143126130 [Alosa pseudoharengus]|uniref:uncharacterized protein LOC143126130 n=1 Tax=Alosa pseudoharengus TaxID=34774 RepID=UPI003F8A21AE
MEQIWIEGIRRKMKKEKDSLVSTEIKILHGEKKVEFMERCIQEIKEKEHIFFLAAKQTSPNYYHHACERGNTSVQKSNGGPCKTRANSCEAYVSFKFIEEASYTAVLIRQKLIHTGHDFKNPEEKKKSPINPELVGFVEMWLSQGLSISQILLKSCDWACSRGYTDKHDRRYFLTPEDVRSIKRHLLVLNLPDIDDAVSVEKLVTDELKEQILYFQPLTKDQPLIVVVQTPAQMSLLQENPHPMVFMDASYKGLTSYGYALYALLLVNQTGRGVPFAYLIMSHESSATLQLCLTKLCSRNPNFYPRSVMIDRDLKELNAIRQVFPNTKVLLCWFHVLQAVHRWLTSRDGGNLSTEERNTVMHGMHSMKACSTEEKFVTVFNAICKDLDTQLGSNRVTNYLKAYWLPHSALWANFGRLFEHNSSETNNKAERFFLALKYQFLRGQANRRVDQLLRLLCGDVQKYYCYLDDLADAGRLMVSSSASTTTAAETSLGQQIQINEAGKCSVQIGSDSTTHTVDLIRMQCDCGSYNMGNLCTHIIAACTKAQHFVDIAQLRADVAKDIVSNNQYHIDGDYLTVNPTDQNTSFISTVDPAFCTCAVNSYGQKCVCLHVYDCLQTIEAHMSTPPTADGTTLCPPKNLNSQAQLQLMLTDLLEWSKSDNYRHNNQVHAALKRAHTLAFSRFAIVSRRKKISALQAYRQRIEHAKREVYKKPQRRRRRRV